MKQTLTPPYHPASNGAAERSVQILKQNLTKQVLHSGDKLSTSRKLATFLFTYRNTPHMVTGETPASMFLKRKPRTRLSSLHPNIAESVEKQQKNQQRYHDLANHKLREFKMHDGVQVKNFQGGAVKWKYGVVVKRLGPLNYLVKIGNQTKKVHVDHMLPNSLTDQNLKENDTTEDWDFVPLEVSPTEPPTSNDTPSASDSSSDNTHAETRRYPQRTRRPVKRFEMVEL